MEVSTAAVPLPKAPSTSSSFDSGKIYRRKTVTLKSAPNLSLIIFDLNNSRIDARVIPGKMLNLNLKCKY
jgi:hypothetical protein